MQGFLRLLQYSLSCGCRDYIPPILYSKIKGGCLHHSGQSSTLMRCYSVQKSDYADSLPVVINRVLGPRVILFLFFTCIQFLLENSVFGGLYRSLPIQSNEQESYRMSLYQTGWVVLYYSALSNTEILRSLGSLDGLPPTPQPSQLPGHVGTV